MKLLSIALITAKAFAFPSSHADHAGALQSDPSDKTAPKTAEWARSQI